MSEGKNSRLRIGERQQEELAKPERTFEVGDLVRWGTEKDLFKVEQALITRNYSLITTSYIIREQKSGHTFETTADKLTKVDLLKEFVDLL